MTARAGAASRPERPQRAADDRRAERPDRAEHTDEAELRDASVAEDGADEERSRDFAAWMAAETTPVIRPDKPTRVTTPDEDPMALLAELQPPSWLDVAGLSAIDDAALAPGLNTPGPQALPQAAGPPTGRAAGQAGQAAPNPATEAEAPPMFEVEVEYEPPPATLKRPAGPQPAAGSAQAPSGAAVGAAPDAGGFAEALSEAGESKPLQDARALPREVSVREYVPALKTVRVTVDKSLSLEVSPADGDGVSVKLDGTADALRAMADIEGELRDELNQSGYQLDEFESQERESGESSEDSAGEAGAAEADEAGEAEARAVTHGGLVDAVA